MDELNAVMDTDEFLTWAAYSSLEPFLEDRADVHTGMVMALQYNMNRSKGKPAKKPGDFIPEWHKAARLEMTTEQLGAVMRAQYLAMGGDPKKLT